MEIIGVYPWASVPDGYMTDDEGNIVKRPDMGDRFYTQQLAATGKAPGKKDQKPDRVTKADLLAKLPTLAGLAKLTMQDLQLLIAEKVLVKSTNLSVPSGRLKKPYIDELNKLSCVVDWNKLTVAELKEIIHCRQK